MANRLTLVTSLILCTFGLRLQAQEDTEGLKALEDQLAGHTFAIVNQQVITWSDIEPPWREAKARLSKKYSGRELEANLLASLKQMVEGQVDYLLLLEEAERWLPEGMPALAEARAESLLRERRQQAGGRVKLENRLFGQNLSLEQLKQEEKEWGLVVELIRQKVNLRAAISARELRQYYRAHLKNFRAPKEMVIRQIFIPFAEFEARERAQQTASSLLKQLQAGADFGELAKTHSRGLHADEGGLWPRMKAQDFREPLTGIIASLAPRETSGIIETQDGFHIIKMVWVHPEHTVPFENVQQEIRQELYEKKRKKLLSDYLLSLREKAYIEYRWPRLTWP